MMAQAILFLAGAVVGYGCFVFGMGRLSLWVADRLLGRQANAQ